MAAFEKYYSCFDWISQPESMNVRKVEHHWFLGVGGGGGEAGSADGSS